MLVDEEREQRKGYSGAGKGVCGTSVTAAATVRQRRAATAQQRCGNGVQQRRGNGVQQRRGNGAATAQQQQRRNNGTERHAVPAVPLLRRAVPCRAVPRHGTTNPLSYQ